MPLPAPDRWDRLPSVTRLISRPVLSYVRHGSIWEIGWNGSWVNAWKAALEPGQARALIPPDER